MLSERDYYLGFSLFSDIGPKRFDLLIKFFGSAKKIWFSTENELFNTNLPGKIVQNFIRFRERIVFEKIIEDLERKRIQFLTLADKNYPKILRQISDPPIVLYLRGRMSVFENEGLPVAIVGTRNMTVYGKEATEKLVREMPSHKTVIVSGLALGIDTVAHKTALETKSPTIAVLGSGIDRIYPPANYDLYWNIIKSGNLVVSEYPPSIMPSKSSFPLRNRIIAGLSKAVIVVEGRKTSGALITAKYALESGREVFAVPGPINSPMSAGTSYLIKNGANIATKASDIFESVNF